MLFTGDSLGAGKPASGAGISKALESGLAAGECAIAALQNGGPDDFTNYAQRMEAAWGREYKRGRYFHKLAGIPAVANNGIKLIDNALLPRPDAQVAVQEGTGPAAQVQVVVQRRECADLDAATTSRVRDRTVAAPSRRDDHRLGFDECIKEHPDDNGSAIGPVTSPDDEPKPPAQDLEKACADAPARAVKYRWLC